jgi:hypothetical protein
MSQQLPIELWQSILRYSISVPIFFDVDPAATSIEEFVSHYVDERSYWTSERRRNKLRRVCSAWNIYLQQFDHRFVRLQDIVEMFIPLSAIRRARRVKLYYLFEGYRAGKKPLQTALAQEGEWAVTILEGGTPELDEMMLSSRKIPHLKSILSIYAQSLIHATHLFPSLTLALFEGVAVGQTSISLPSLTTLRVAEIAINASHSWKFGSLQHLSFRFNAVTPGTFIEMLRSIGQNLITCIDDSLRSDEEFPDETWSLCPRLRQIQTSFSWPTNTSIPTSIQCIRISADIIHSTSEAPSLSRLPAMAILKAGIQNVRFEWR